MTTEKQTGDELLLAAVACPHEIDHGRVVLHFDPKQPGHNALNQLRRRLASAQAQQAMRPEPCPDIKGYVSGGGLDHVMEKVRAGFGGLRCLCHHCSSEIELGDPLDVVEITPADAKENGDG